MPPLVDSSRLFRQPWRSVYAPFRAMVESALGLDQINVLYENCRGGGPEDFIAKILSELGISWDWPEPGRGLACEGGRGVMVVANHPFGGPEALLLFLLLNRLRADYRILANSVLGQVAEITPRMLLVNPFGGADAPGKNRAPLRQALKFLRQGGMLGVFPAGEVSSWRMDLGRVEDKDWNSQLGRLALAAGADVLPLYFEGRNPAYFHALGMVSPRLRTLLLPRMVFRNSHKKLIFRFGPRLRFEDMQSLGNPALVTSALRARTYALA